MKPGTRALFVFGGLLFACAAAPALAPAKPTQLTEKIAACGVLRHPHTRYVLAQDVQSPGTCFAIEADGITLDLKGHTVTYATASNPAPVFGVLAADCWFQAIAGNPCGGSHRNPVVMNGSIVQGPGAAPFSHALRFGQGINMTGIVVHNLNITVHAEDSIPIYSEYLPGGSDVYGNTIHNNVRTISSRTQFRGASIKLDNEDQAKLPDNIHDNIIRGGAQIGIRSDNPARTKIFRNDISQDAVYTNGFCIDAAGDNMLVIGNTCHPVHGRGLHANHSNVLIDHNIVETVGSDQIAEYHGCELNGTYGIQIENDGNNPQHMTVTNNKVTVHARECEAEAMRITDLHNTAIDIHGNTFSAVQDTVAGKPSDKHARAFSVGDVDGEGMEIFNNVMTADSAIFHEDWDSANAITLKHNVFQAGRAGKSTLLAEFDNGAKESRHIVFADDTYRGVNTLNGHIGEYVGDSWFQISQSITVHPQRSDGRPLKEAHGTVNNANGELIGFADLDANGAMVFTVAADRVENKKPVEKFDHFTFTIRAPGCSEYANTLRSLPSEKLNWTLTCN